MASEGALDPVHARGFGHGLTYIQSFLNTETCRTANSNYGSYTVTVAYLSAFLTVT